MCILFTCAGPLTSEHFFCTRVMFGMGCVKWCRSLVRPLWELLFFFRTWHVHVCCNKIVLKTFFITSLYCLLCNIAPFAQAWELSLLYSLWEYCCVMFFVRFSHAVRFPYNCACRWLMGLNRQPVISVVDIWYSLFGLQSVHGLIEGSSHSPAMNLPPGCVLQTLNAKPHL